ncbi:hypothetical protein Ahy_B04g072481 [Arachis hypogaea]|uniref:Uncharacterized protein n=1 Tax=Arachis hypogaea TaxID=3818 RepID=A0A444ZN31_ARAHY|nr:hypothetical protein Ahy_B04g072481 [Arachis hypogaea]
MMQDIREGCDHLTIWFLPDIKKELDVHFSTDEGFKYRHLTNRTNKALPRSSKYIETFKYRHMLKANMERFADERSTTHYRLEVVTQQSQPSGDNPGFGASVVDLNRIWRETASELYKNHIYGLGLFFASSLHTSTLAASSISASAISPSNPEEVVNLRGGGAEAYTRASPTSSIG